jgi:hypothetical protein
VKHLHKGSGDDPVWLVLSCQSTKYEVIFRIHGTPRIAYLLSCCLQLWSCKFIIIIIIIIVVVVIIIVVVHVIVCSVLRYYY